MKTFRTGDIARILGDKNARQVARMVDNDIIHGKMINGKNGRARRSYRVVSRATLMKYIDNHCQDNQSAISWLLSQKIDDFIRQLTQAEKEHGYIGEHAGLADGLRAVVWALRPDTSESFDPLSRVVFEDFFELMMQDRRLLRLKMARAKR